MLLSFKLLTFGQCPHPVFHSAHLKKRPNLQMRRNLREMLLLSNPSSIYEQNQPAWIGKYCRIHAISDYDAEVMKACYGNLRYVLGSSSQDQFPSSHLASISWPVESSYPWCITVDCNEYTELRLVKIVLVIPSSLIQLQTELLQVRSLYKRRDLANMAL